MNPTSAARKEVIGLHRITEKRIRELCKKDKLYQTPELNDVLYLHYQGFQYIECLEKYTELKCLWLECNAISEIEGLNNQSKLKCLFLQNNLIKRIENLDPCRELDTLNLSSNHIRKIENCGVDVLPVLNTLNLSSNYLRDAESLHALEECKTLSVLDLANNRIDDILVVKVFAKMPQLRVLVLQGNPVVSKLPQYRKTLILECKELTYLDSRPVFPRDRACAEAWKRGGYAEERKEQGRWNRKERKKIRDSVNATIRMRNKYLPKEKQQEIFTSSDSETEERRKREDTEEINRTDPRLLMATEDDDGLLSVWDEVSTADPTAEEREKVNNTDSLSEKIEVHTKENEVEKKPEIVERVTMGDILHIVEGPTTDEDIEMPKLITGAEELMMKRKRPLVEEISCDDAAIHDNSSIPEEDSVKLDNAMEETVPTETMRKQQQTIEIVRPGLISASNDSVPRNNEQNDTSVKNQVVFKEDLKTTEINSTETKTSVKEPEENCNWKKLFIEEIIAEDLERNQGRNELGFTNYNKKIEENRHQNDTSVKNQLVFKEDLKTTEINSTETKTSVKEPEENCNWKKLFIEEIIAEDLERNQGRNELGFTNYNKKIEENRHLSVKERKASSKRFIKLNKKHKAADFTDDDSTDSSSISSISFESSTAEQQNPNSDSEGGFDSKSLEVINKGSIAVDDADMGDSKIFESSVVAGKESLKPPPESEVGVDEPFETFEKRNITAVVDVNPTEPVPDSESEDDETKQECSATARAICEVVMQRLGSHEQPQPERIVYVPFETADNSTETYEPELEMQKILDRLPDDETDVRTKRMESVNTELPDERNLHKTVKEIEYERKCEEVNQQVVRDFEELTHNMDRFIEEFQQNRDEEAEHPHTDSRDNDDYSKNSSAAVDFETKISFYSSKETVIQKQLNSEKTILVQRKAQDDVQLDIAFDAFALAEEGKGVESISTNFKLASEQNASLLDDSPSFSVEAELVSFKKLDEKKLPEKSESAKALKNNVGMETNSTSTKEKDRHFDKPLEEKHQWVKDDDKNAKATNETKPLYSQNVETSDLMENREDEDYVAAASNGNRCATESDEENVSIESSNSAVQCSSSMTAYEEESRNLKKLLCKLEDQNEKWSLAKNFGNQLVVGNQGDESCCNADEEDASESEENAFVIKYVINEVVTEVLDTKAPKSFEIIDLESDEEFSYSEPPKEEEEKPVESIRNVLSAFNDLVREIGRKNIEERKTEYSLDPQRTQRTQAEKAKSLKTLIETPSLLEHHKDTYDSLQLQVTEVKQHQNEKLKKLVDRVYAQKDQYENSLELIDGRLVVVKKDSGEIEEIPRGPSPYGAADTDDEEDRNSNKSAVSSDDEAAVGCSTVVTNSENNTRSMHAWDFGMGAFKPHTWTPVYKPTMRKSAAQLILDAINENNADAAAKHNSTSHDDSDCGEEPEPIEKGVFSNIDEEFFKNFDFKKVANESAQDENFVECARSYEELRHYLRSYSKETSECSLTTDEKTIMAELQSTNAENSNSKDDLYDELLKEEDLLLQNLVERTKEAQAQAELTTTEVVEEVKQYDETGKRIDIYRCEDAVVVSSETPNAKRFEDVIFELKPTERVQAKMLQELNEKKNCTESIPTADTQDLGDFTEPLGENFDLRTLEEEEIDFDAVRSAYAVQLNKWKLALQEKRKANVECTEVGTQSDPSDAYFLPNENSNEEAKESLESNLEELQEKKSETELTQEKSLQSDETYDKS